MRYEMEIWGNIAVFRQAGYDQKKKSVRLRYSGDKVTALLDMRTEEGYLLGWKKGPGGYQGVTAYLRYTADGTPSVTSIHMISCPHDLRTVTSKGVWQWDGQTGRCIMHTRKGRMSSKRVQERKMVGSPIMWVS